MPDTAIDLASQLEDLLRPHLRFLKAGDAVPMDEDLGRLGLDSMASIDLLMEIEGKLGLQIPDEMMTTDTFSTGNHLLAVLQKLV